MFIYLKKNKFKFVNKWNQELSQAGTRHIDDNVHVSRDCPLNYQRFSYRTERINSRQTEVKIVDYSFFYLSELG